MKKIFIFFVILFMSFPAFSQRRVEEVVKKQKVVNDTRINLRDAEEIKGIVCGGSNKTAYALVGDLYFPPFSWVVEKDYDNYTKKTLQGIGVDYFKYLLNNTFQRVFSSENIVVSTNEEIKKSMLRGSADVHVNSYYDINPSLGLDYIFPAYLSSHVIAVTRKNDTDTVIKNLEDLKKYKGVIRDNENMDWIYKSMDVDINNSKNLVVIQASDTAVKEAFTLLLSGEVDYFLTNLYSARAEIARYKVYNDLTFNEGNILKQNLMFFAISKMSPPCRFYKKDIEASLNKDIEDSNALRDIVLNNIVKYAESYANEPKLIVENKNKNKKSSATTNSDETIPNLVK